MKSFQIGATLKSYTYSEPSIDVEHKGLLYGIWGEWLWGSPLGNGRTTGDLVFGTIDYSGSYTDGVGNEFPLNSTTQDIIGKVTSRFEFGPNPGLIFFAGFGGRYLYDMGNGPEFYQRKGLWFFIPVGGYISADTSSGKLFLDLQYDYIVYGKFESRLSDVLAGYPTIEHTQSGYGLTLTGGLQNEDYSFAAFYELWKLNESNAVEFQSFTFTEPENTGTVFGLKLGYKF